mmetsp:Transcript_22557/g.33631  ORF Transcript_22557/g.33631 Transcript_22557/m.33631 type:complete len:339 (+) Transcript_22557:436-1452(+)
MQNVLIEARSRLANIKGKKAKRKSKKLVNYFSNFVQNQTLLLFNKKDTGSVTETYTIYDAPTDNEKYKKNALQSFLNWKYIAKNKKNVITKHKLSTSKNKPVDILFDTLMKKHLGINNTNLHGLTNSLVRLKNHTPLFIKYYPLRKNNLKIFRNIVFGNIHKIIPNITKYSMKNNHKYNKIIGSVIGTYQSYYKINNDKHNIIRNLPKLRNLIPNFQTVSMTKLAFWYTISNCRTKMPTHIIDKKIALFHVLNNFILLGRYHHFIKSKINVYITQKYSKIKNLLRELFCIQIKYALSIFTNLNNRKQLLTILKNKKRIQLVDTFTRELTLYKIHKTNI